MDEEFAIVALAMCAVTGGTVAWRYATWNLYRRPGAKWSTDQIHPDRINRRLLARRKRHRLQITFMAGLMSPVLVLALFGLFEFVVKYAYTR